MQSGVIRSSAPAKVKHAHQVRKAQCPCEAQLRRWRSGEGLRQLHQREATSRAADVLCGRVDVCGRDDVCGREATSTAAKGGRNGRNCPAVGEVEIPHRYNLPERGVTCGTRLSLIATAATSTTGLRNIETKR